MAPAILEKRPLSEHDLQAGLNLARLVLCTEHLAEVRIAEIQNRSGIDGSVKGVERFDAKLERFFLGERKLPEQRKVQVLHPIRAHDIASRVAKGEGRGRGKGRGVEPARPGVT